VSAVSPLRFAAGVCVLTAGLLIGGVGGAVAVADPGAGGPAAHGDNGTNASGQPKKPKDDPAGTDTKGGKKDPGGTDTKGEKKDPIGTDTKGEKKDPSGTDTEDEKKDSLSAAAAPAVAPAPAAAPAPGGLRLPAPPAAPSHRGQTATDSPYATGCRPRQHGTKAPCGGPSLWLSEVTAVEGFDHGLSR
jgi:hypothetical protein